MIKLMLITNDTELATYAYSCGVERIFVDLERLGKCERQGHLDTVISNHNIRDVGKIRRVLPDATILVRINPLNKNSENEINMVIDEGADIIMLPMFRTSNELEQIAKFINGRVKFIPLLETKAAVDNINSIIKVSGVDSFHIGLNDLHLEYKLGFMFELLTNGIVNSLVEIFQAHNIKYGIGGIARMDEGVIPGNKVLAEYVRLKSSAVILSRTFHKRSDNKISMLNNINLKTDIFNLRIIEERLLKRSVHDVEKDKVEFKTSLIDI